MDAGLPITSVVILFALNSMVRSETPHVEENKVTLYNSSTELCCDGKAFSISENITMKCCRDKPYDIKTHVCCHGALHLRISGDMACCEKLLFNKKTHYCCWSNVVPKPSTHKTKYECCKTALFNPTKEICCDGKLYRRYGSDTMCCDNLAYNMSTHRCCYGKEPKVYETKDDYQCCSNKYYNQKTEACCFGRDPKIYPKQNNFRCCESNYYDITKMMCCRSSTYGEKVTPLVGNGEDCCQGIGFNKSTHLCCHDVIFSKDNGLIKCCAEKPYNPSINICCNKVLHPHNENDTECCGKESYNVSSETKCCGNVLYNSAIEKCNDNYFHKFTYPKNEDPENWIDSNRCGKIKYKPSKHMCCGKKLYFKEKNPDLSCCSDKTFNTTQQACCDGVITDIKDPDKEECCYKI